MKPSVVGAQSFRKWLLRQFWLYENKDYLGEITNKLTVQPIFLPSTSPSFIQSLQEDKQLRESDKRRDESRCAPLSEPHCALRPVVQQPLHQPGDGGDQRDPALPPRLSLDLLQQAAGRTERDKTERREHRRRRVTKRKREREWGRSSDGERKR